MALLGIGLWVEALRPHLFSTWFIFPQQAGRPAASWRSLVCVHLLFECDLSSCQAATSKLLLDRMSLLAHGKKIAYRGRFWLSQVVFPRPYFTNFQYVYCFGLGGSVEGPADPLTAMESCIPLAGLNAAPFPRLDKLPGLSIPTSIHAWRW